MAEPIDLEARLDELFTTPPDRFVATREALVKELKREGRREDADTVHALRRPTVAVWGINQIARTHRDELARLVEAGAELEERQAEGAAARDDIRAATRARRALLDDLTEAAAALTERPEAVRTTIAATLDAASLDDVLHDDLVRGRLTTELSPAVRFFGDVGHEDDAAPARRAPRRPATKPATRPAPPDDLAIRRAETALGEARARAKERGDDARESERATHDAERELDAARRRVADLETALSDARASVAELKRAATEAQRAETRARTAHTRAEAAVQAAERQVEQARGSSGAAARPKRRS